MTTRLVERDGVSILDVEGEIDVAVKTQFTAALDGAVDAAERLVLIDLRGVRYLDSCACHCLVAAAARAEHRGVVYRVTNPSHRARRVLTISGLEALFNEPSPID